MALPVNGSIRLIPALLLIYRPGKDERLSWPGWLTCSGRFTHISACHPSAAGRAQDRESSPATDRRSTTVPRHQLARANNIHNSARMWRAGEAAGETENLPRLIAQADDDQRRSYYYYYFFDPR